MKKKDYMIITTKALWENAKVPNANPGGVH
jgi:hypothetical protein